MSMGEYADDAYHPSTPMRHNRHNSSHSSAGAHGAAYVDPRGSQPMYSAGASHHHYQACPPPTLHPVGYAQGHGYPAATSSPVTPSTPGYPSPPYYQGPMQNGHPIVPSQSPGLPPPAGYYPYAQPYAAQPPHGGYAYSTASAAAPGGTGAAGGGAGGSSSSAGGSANQPAPIRCVQCGTTFTRRHDLGRHMDSHHGDATHDCPYCGRKYARADTLKRHIDSPCPNAPKKGHDAAAGGSRGRGAA